MSDIFNLTDTWNNGATTFAAIKMNVTDTASDAASKLLDLQVGGASVVNVRKDGLVQITGPSSTAAVIGSTTQFRPGGVCIGQDMAATGGVAFSSDAAGSTIVGGISNLGLHLLSASRIGWGAAVGSTPDLTLTRDAANTLAQRNGVNAQTFNSYRTFTDAANFQRLSHAWNTSTALVMNEGLGTGADGSVAFNDAALATTATKGFVMIPSCAGAPTGVPADIPTGQIPMVWDSTNLKLYVYTGATWKSSAVFA